MNQHYKLYNAFCRSLVEKNQIRGLEDLKNCQFGDTIIDFTSNDYLLFSKNQVLIEAFCSFIKEFGIGATGSRLLSGNNKVFIELEQKIAYIKNTEAALVFSSGYQANSTVLSTILDQKVLGHEPIVFFDKLNHASLYHACFLAKAQMIRYMHCDMNHLEDLLLQYKNDKRCKFIVSETLFGMDGDIADIGALINLAEQYNAFLYLDEAHATGLFGKNGYGLSTMYNFGELPYIIMGTFSKALGASGGYIACSADMHKYIVNKCGGFIYSTAMLPAIAFTISKAIDMLPGMNETRDKIINLAQYMKGRLLNIGYDIGNSANCNTHIIPIIMQNNIQALQYKDFMLNANIKISAIRPPTVPRPRLRVAINASHDTIKIEKFLDCIAKLRNI